MAGIRVVNKHALGGRPVAPPEGTTRISVMRGASALGNPYPMKSSSLDERNRVCDEYDKWLPTKLLQEGAELRQFNELVKIAKGPNVLELVCCCAPKRCHADTIKKLLEKTLTEEDTWNFISL